MIIKAAARSQNIVSAGRPRDPRRHPVDYFNHLADHYAQNYRTTRRTFVNGRHEQLVAIVDALAAPPGTRMLDAGCGPGNLSLHVARRGWDICAMDAAPRMIDLAQAAARQQGFSNIAVQVGSIEALPFADGAFDIVCSAGVIEYLRSCDRALAEFQRVLKPGGTLILPTTNMLAPAHWLRRPLQRIARNRTVGRWFGVKPPLSGMWFHFIPRFRRRLRDAGLALERDRYFYLTLPRPVDRLFPSAARALERSFDPLMDTPIRCLAEGYIAIARKPVGRRGSAA